LNATSKNYSYILPFIGEILNKVANHDAYSFLYKYSNYHQISTTPKKKYKTTFVTNWGTFSWIVMPFGIKNEPPTYHQIVSQAFREYLKKFIKIFLHDLIVYSLNKVYKPLYHLWREKKYHLIFGTSSKSKSHLLAPHVMSDMVALEAMLFCKCYKLHPQTYFSLPHLHLS
jgi:hypothetical protein